jgi:hypothetical protein
VRRVRRLATLPRTYDRGALADNKYPEDGAYASNNCGRNTVCELDSPTLIADYTTLIIGEDAGQHQNDMVRAYNIEPEELAGVQTTPYGSETTSPHFYPGINDFSYIMSVIQRPFGESDQDALRRMKKPAATRAIWVRSLPSRTKIPTMALTETGIMAIRGGVVGNRRLDALSGLV